MVLPRSIKNSISRSASSSSSGNSQQAMISVASSPTLSLSPFSAFSSSSSGWNMRRLRSKCTVLTSYRPSLPVLVPLKASKLQPKHSLRAYGRLALISIRLCKQSEENMDKERGDMMSFREMLVQVNSAISKYSDIFNIGDFKADKQAHLSQEARRVLQTPPPDRSEQDISYLLVALRNIPSFAEYPTRMQKKLCQVAWFESYEPRRTIVKEGDPPRAFYFILSGSVEVTKRDQHYGTTRTLVILEQGMSFGELAVITGSRRQATVSSETKVEMLCISGPGSLSVMKKLHHVDACDDETTDVNGNKIGRCLHLADNIKRKRKERRNPEIPEVFRNSMEADRRLVSTLLWNKLSPAPLNDNDRLGLIDYDRIITDYRSRIQSKAGFESQTSALPPIPAHEAHSDGSSVMTEQEPKKADMMVAETVERDRRKEEVSSTDKCIGTSTRHERMQNSTDGSQCIENSADAKTGKLIKGVYLGPSGSTGEFRADNSARKASQESSSSETKMDILTRLYSDGSPTAHLYRLNIDYQRKFREHVGRKTMADQLDYKGSRDFRYTEVDLNPMFVVAKVLEKGQYFGVSQLLFPEQPSLSLVSNGAELVVLSKKLFMEHANDACMRNLRITESPFPAQDELQSSLQDFVNWKAHRARVYHRLVSGIERKQSRRKQFLPSMPPGRYNFRSGPV